MHQSPALQLLGGPVRGHHSHNNFPAIQISLAMAASANWVQPCTSRGFPFPSGPIVKGMEHIWEMGSPSGQVLIFSTALLTNIHQFNQSCSLWIIWYMKNPAVLITVFSIVTDNTFHITVSANPIKRPISSFPPLLNINNFTKFTSDLYMLVNAFLQGIQCYIPEQPKLTY